MQVILRAYKKSLRRAQSKAIRRSGVKIPTTIDREAVALPNRNSRLATFCDLRHASIPHVHATLLGEGWPGERVMAPSSPNLSHGVIQALQLLPKEPAMIRNTGRWGAVMTACLAQKNRPFGLMPFDWLMLFGGTVLGGMIVLLF
jgi:hypothetical protein